MREYSPTDGKCKSILEKELYDTYCEYPEYRKNMSFIDMVYKFASDDFYKLHLVARKYIGFGHTA